MAKKLKSKLEILAEKYTDEELGVILEQTKKKIPEEKTYRFDGDDVRFLAFGDPHMGHEKYDPGLMKAMAKEANKWNCDFAMCTGDICEGWYTNRPGHMFELTHMGLDEQLDYSAEQLNQLEMPIYFITGNHTVNTFYKHAGIDIGIHLQNRLENSVYLGDQRGKLLLNSGKSIEMIHPDGGTAYAISYKSQKIVESLEGGSKPEVLLIGHFHKAEYIFYRNIHVMQTGTLCGQSSFMRNKAIPAHKGFWIVDMTTNKEGVAKITPEFYPAYD